MIRQEEDLPKTTILIETQTREVLRKLGVKGESYDDIIRRLVGHWRQSHEVPVPKVSGEDAPEGFTKNEVLIYKGYFCKFMCKKEWDNFYEYQVFENDELKEYARAIYNEETYVDFFEKIFDSDADYQRITKFVMGSLVNQDLLTRELESDGKSYYYLKTSKLKALCPKISKVILPVIDFLVEQYEKEHGKK